MVRETTKQEAGGFGEAGQRITEEQLHDVYMEGSSDGKIRLQDKTIRIAKED
jgi:hypothetical protein